MAPYDFIMSIFLWLNMVLHFEFFWMHYLVNISLKVFVDSLRLDYFSQQGNRTNIGAIRESDEVTSDSQDSALSSSSPPNQIRVPYGITDSPSPTSSLTSFCEDADSGIFCLHFVTKGRLLLAPLA